MSKGRWIHWVLGLAVILGFIGVPGAAQLDQGFEPDPIILQAFEQLTAYVAEIPAESLPNNLKNSLTQKLGAARASYERGQPCVSANQMQAFANEAQALIKTHAGIPMALYYQGLALRQEILASVEVSKGRSCRGKWANRPPVADAGADQTVAVGQTVTLDGSDSVDYDGDQLSYNWSFVTIPDGSGAVLSDPLVVQPTFTADLPGDYVVRLIVNDGAYDSAPDTVTITTANSPPVADAGPDQSVYVNDSVTLDGSGSSDVDGDLLSFSWSWISRPAGSTAEFSDPTVVQPQFTVDLAGEYDAKLVVNDGELGSDPDTVTILTLNNQPVADAGADQSVYVGDNVLLDGSGSSDVDGDALSYSWSLLHKPLNSTAVLSDSTAVMPMFTIDEPGIYIPQLIVNDGELNSEPDTVTITTVNSKPVADAGADQEVIVGEPVSLDGSGSSDADNDPLTYQWSFVSMPAGSGAVFTGADQEIASFEPDRAGLYVVQLLVHDGTLSSEPDSALVTVLAAPVAVDDGPYGVNEDATLTVSAPGVLDNDSDADGDPITAVLAKGAGFGAVGLAADGSFTYTPGPNYYGPDSFEYYATDGVLNSLAARVAINVVPFNDPPNLNAGPDRTVSEGTPVYVRPFASDPDSDALTFSAEGLPAGAVISGQTGNVSWTPGYDQAGVYPLTIRASDGELTVEDQLIITVENRNRPPEWRPVFDRTAYVGDAVNFQVQAVDPDDDVVTLSGALTEGTLAFSLAQVGPGTAAFSAAPGVTDIGTHRLRYTVDDGDLSATVESLITVKDRSEMPDPLVPGDTLSLIELRVAPSIVSVGAGETAALMVTGVYSDGSTADLTQAVAGTTYASGTPTVASVGDSGGVAGLLAGDSVVSVANSGLQTRALVKVAQDSPPECAASLSEPVFPETRFAEPRIPPIGSQEHWYNTSLENTVAWGDFNEDGRADFILNGDPKTSSFQRYMDLYFGDGLTWAFGYPLRWAVVTDAGDDHVSVVRGDFNGDGHHDIAAVDLSGSQVGVVLGNGDGSFQPADFENTPLYHVVTGQQAPGILAVGDFNNDGLDDLAVAPKRFGTVPVDAHISVLLNQGGNQFSVSAEIPLSASTGLSTGDFNGDGASDLMWRVINPYLSTQTLDLLIAVSNGDGSFAAPVSVWDSCVCPFLGSFCPSTHRPIGLDFVTDLDHDGKDDLGVLQGGNDFLAARLLSCLDFGVDGFQRFAQPGSSDDGHSLVAGTHLVHDFDGDCFPDIVTKGPGTGDLAVELWWGEGDGTFNRRAVFPNSPYSYPVALQDVNGDGVADVVTDFSVLYGQAPGEFVTPEYDLESPLGSRAEQVADLTGDGKAEFIEVFVSTAPGAGSNNGAAFSVQVFSRESGGIYVQLTDTQFLWDPLEPRPSIGASIADFDNDGNEDLAILGTNGLGSAAVMWLRSDGVGGFEPMEVSTISGFGFNIRAIFVGDFDGNGFEDLLATYAVSNLQTSDHDAYVVLWNQGEWNFTASAPIPSGDSPLVKSWTSVQAGDMNGDGRDDLLGRHSYQDSSSGSPKTVTEFQIGLSQGNGVFIWSTLPWILPSDYVLGDFNENGYTDIAGIQSFFPTQSLTQLEQQQLANTVSFFCANGGNAIFSCRAVSVGFPAVPLPPYDAPPAYSSGSGFKVSGVADMDNDGHLDVVGHGQFAGAHIYFGDGTGHFPRLESYGDRHVDKDPEIGDFDGDGRLDFQLGSTFSVRFLQLPPEDAPVTVIPLSISVSPATIVLFGSATTQTLAVDARFSDGSMRTLTGADGVGFQTSEPGAATVAADGTITPVSSGRAIVTVSYDGLIQRVPVLVVIPEELQSLETSAANVYLYMVPMEWPEMADIVEAMIESIFTDPYWASLLDDVGGTLWTREVIEQAVRAALGVAVDRDLFTVPELKDFLWRAFGAVTIHISAEYSRLTGHCVICVENDAGWEYWESLIFPAKNFFTFGEYVLAEELFNRGIDTTQTVGLQDQVTVTGIFSNGFAVNLNQLEGFGLSFTSSDPAVATVDGFGAIYAVAPGTSTLTISLNEVSLGETIYVHQPVSGVVQGVIANVPESITADEKLTASMAFSGDDYLGGLPVRFVLTVEGTDKPYIVIGYTDSQGIATVKFNDYLPAGPARLEAVLLDTQGSETEVRTDQALVIEPGWAANVIVWTSPPTAQVGEPVEVHTRVTDTADNVLPITPELFVPGGNGVIDRSVMPPTVAFSQPGAHRISARLAQPLGFESSDSFTVAVRAQQSEVVITQVTPDTVAPGGGVRISGVGFTADALGIQVSFGGIIAEVTEVLNGTELYVTVPEAVATLIPEGETVGNIQVTVTNDGAQSNAVDLTIDPRLTPREKTDADREAGFIAGEIIFIPRQRDGTCLTTTLFPEGTAVQGKFGAGGYCLARLPEGTTHEQTLRILDMLTLGYPDDARSRHPDVLAAMVNRVVKPKVRPDSDDEIAAQGHLHLTNMFLGQHSVFPHMGEDVTIAVIDCGVSPELALGNDPEINLVGRKKLLGGMLSEDHITLTDSKDDSDGYDLLEHGSSVASTAAARENTRNGIGVAPKASILSVRICKNTTNADTSLDDMWDAIAYAMAEKAEVINVSQSPDYFLAEAHAWFEERRVSRAILDNLFLVSTRLLGGETPVIVFAGGNERENPKLLPLTNPQGGGHPSVFVVGAMSNKKAGLVPNPNLWLLKSDPLNPFNNEQPYIAQYSNMGWDLDVVAPADVYTTNEKGEMFETDGTSHAAPQVAGLAALIIAEKKAKGQIWSAQSIKEEIIRNYTLDLDDPSVYCSSLLSLPVDSDCRLYMKKGFDTISGYGMIYLHELYGVAYNGFATERCLIYPGYDTPYPPTEIPYQVCSSVQNTISDPEVVKIGPNGQINSVWFGDPLVYPFDLEVLPDGHLAILDSGRGLSPPEVPDGKIFRMFNPEQESDVTPVVTTDLYSPYRLNSDGNGGLYVLDRLTHPSVAISDRRLYDAALLQFNKDYQLTGIRSLALPPRPWPNTDNVYYWWPEQDGYVQFANLFNDLWMGYSDKLRATNGGTGLFFSYTPFRICWGRYDHDICDFPQENGALLYMKDFALPLELLFAGNPTNTWYELGGPVGSDDRPLYFPALGYAASGMKQLTDTTQDWTIVPNIKHYGQTVLGKEGNLFVFNSYYDHTLSVYKRNPDPTKLGDFILVRSLNLKNASGIQSLAAQPWQDYIQYTN